MASKRVPVNAVTDDALATLEIRKVDVPSFVTMWGSCVTNGDKVGLKLNSTDIMAEGELNIESSGDVIDSSRDLLVPRTFVGTGSLRLPVSAVTTELQVLIDVQPAFLPV